MEDGEVVLMSTGDQLTLPHFNGPEYVHERDVRRLSTQLLRVKTPMLDGRWRTLSEIERSTGDPAASVSAQLRHLRKERFGSYVVDRRPRGAASGGLYEYRVSSPKDR